MMISLVSVQEDLGPCYPTTLPARKGLCPMLSLDMLVEIGTILQHCVTNVTWMKSTRRLKKDMTMIKFSEP